MTPLWSAALLFSMHLRLQKYTSEEEETSNTIYNVSLDNGKQKRGKALVY